MCKGASILLVLLPGRCPACVASQLLGPFLKIILIMIMCVVARSQVQLVPASERRRKGCHSSKDLAAVQDACYTVTSTQERYSPAPPLHPDKPVCLKEGVLVQKSNECRQRCSTGDPNHCQSDITTPVCLLPNLYLANSGLFTNKKSSLVLPGTGLDLCQQA